MTKLKIRIILQFFGDSLRGLRVCKNDVVVAGGMERMSNAPKYLVDATLAFWVMWSIMSIELLA